MRKKSQVVRKQSSDGELHFILPEVMLDFDEDEIREIMKNEASKPLLLLRT
jgi:hypothetical protein